MTQKIATYIVSGQSLTLDASNSSKSFVANTLGHYYLHFTFDSDWDGMSKYAVVKCGTSAIKVPLTYDATNLYYYCEIPGELMTKDITVFGMNTLNVGVIGYIDGDSTKRFPTAVNTQFVYHPSIDITDTTVTPTQTTLFEQMQATVSAQATSISTLKSTKADLQVVDEKIALAQLEGAGVDTSNFIVKSQLSKLTDAGITTSMMANSVKTDNLLNPSNVTLGYLLGSDYIEYATEGRFITEYVDIRAYADGIKRVCLAYFENNSFSSTGTFAFYDSQKTPISFHWSGSIVIPTNACYIRATGRYENINRITIYIGDSTKPYPSTYNPYARFKILNTDLIGSMGVSDLLNKVAELDSSNDVKNIYCWGDSLTAGAGGGGVSYPSVLQNLLGDNYNVVNMGIGGEYGDTIACRFGGMLAYFDYDHVCVKNTPIQLRASSEYGRFINPCRTGGGTININIYGATGYVGWSDTLSSPIICMDSDVTIKKGTPLSVRQEHDKAILHLVCLGQNSVGGVNVNPTNDNYKIWCDVLSALKYSTSEDIFFISLVDGDSTYTSTVDMYATKKFGSRYIKLRQELVRNGLEIAGLTATDTDNTAISNGKVPPQLFSDTVHLNSYGYTAWGTIIYHHLKGLGIV